MNPQQPTPGSWRELLGSRYAPVVAVLAGGVLLEASNVYITTSLLPTIVGEIGGEKFYAWTMMTFLLTSVISAMLVSRVLMRSGATRAYLLGLGLFGLGSILCAVSPWMWALLVGRAVQGLGGGLLAGLGYALIQRSLPERLWAKGAAMVSTMWGVGNIVGPIVGGLFAQLDAWRLAFVTITAAAGLIGLVAWRWMPETPSSVPSGTLPWVSLVVLGGAVTAVGVASVMSAGIGTVLVLALGVALGVLFFWYERRSLNGILPRSTFARGSSLRWVYLSVAVLAFGIGVETFIPLFGQEIGGMIPFTAGVLGAALSLGWSASQLFSASATRDGARRVLILAAPILLGLGLLAYGFLQHEGHDSVLIVAWYVSLFVAGAGIGLSFPHLTVAAFGSTRDAEEGSKAAAAINTVFIIASAFAASAAGVLVNLAPGDIVVAARLLVFVFAGVCLLGTFAAHQASRP